MLPRMLLRTLLRILPRIVLRILARLEMPMTSQICMYACLRLIRIYSALANMDSRIQYYELGQILETLYYSVCIPILLLA